VISARSLLATAALLALTAGLIAGPAAAGQGSLPKLATEMPEHELQVRPPVISYTGDGTGFIGGRTTSPPQHLDRGGIHWLSWTARSAFGRGYAWLDDCRPDCAGGRFHKHRATVRATRPRHGRFTRLTIVYRWNGRRVRDRRKLERSGGYWYWGI
jgi:hypothetical protein